MGVSYVVQTIRGPSDERWGPMFAALKACRDAGVPVPAEVVDYFQLEYPDEPGEDPSEDGVATDSISVDMVRPDDESPDGWWTRWRSEYQSGVTVHVDRLPEGTTALRVYLSA